VGRLNYTVIYAVRFHRPEIFLVEDVQQVAGGDGELACFSSQDLRMFEVVCAAPRLQRYALIFG